MLFNSYEFILFFLPITFFIYFYLNQKRLTEGSKAFLVFSSLFFYSWWNLLYLPLIMGSLLFNFVIGKSLSKLDTNALVTKKQLLIVGISGNLALLAYFKYSDFLIKNINYVLGSNLPLLNLALPLAISFFTFQQIAYLVDSFKKETKEYDFLNYAVFVTFFPQLIAGPIVHHKEMMPQFSLLKNKVKNNKNISLGIFIFSIGLFKKVIIADTFSIWANMGFDTASTLNTLEAWCTSLSYTFQLYFDFSGYTDMALGAALLFNIKLPLNFNSPYKASNIQDFWRRWHITLSRFLKDYVYIPLGGNRLGNFRTYSNLLMTFIIGGIWHGAGWLFVIWGTMHGIALVIFRLWEKSGIKLNFIIAWFITFNFINISWIFFRAKNLDDAIKIAKGMFSFDFQFNTKSLNIMLGNINGNSETIIYLFVGFTIALLFKNSVQLKENLTANYFYIAASVFLIFYSILSLNNNSEFLYFNF